ncbi:hypothetical protein pEaSNUABM47_00351 [Erwinia phage pEa_SNUABM_47]|uniref:Uncharacterized protein n=1 Tax=Erwinia phage pEa_SNUABM_47 TaxID=2768774 RepID=A0A7L8ZMY4_9CAUD|nr:hypothetical protein pEaSNUABM47_00351 [Erwinia phage pEa_SNUABM_47]
MSTRSNINVKVGDKYHSVYCHFDGYPSGVGMMLALHYNSQELAEKLVSNGDLSSVYESCEKPEGHSYDTPVKGYCVYYGRDRGEEDTEFSVVDEPVCENDFGYVWDGTKWTIYGHEYDEDDNMIEWYGTPLDEVLGLEVAQDDEILEDEGTKVFKYFGTNMDEVQNIYNEWDVTFNTPDERMTDSYNERIRWMVRHRFAPYQGIDEDGIWHHTFFGRTLYEAVSRANEYLQRAKDMEDDHRG